MGYRSRNSLIALRIVMTALAAFGCGEASPSNDVGPGTGGATSRSPREVRVTWDANGVFDGQFGIQGEWFTLNDWQHGTAAGLESTIPDPELIGPYGSNPRLGWSASPEEICMRGSVPQVGARASDLPADGVDMRLAYEAQWGAGMAFSPTKWNAEWNEAEPYDALAHSITGFEFDITQGTRGEPAPPTLVINLKSASADDDASHFLTVMLPAVDQVVSFEEVEQGSWVTEPTQFRANAITLVMFHITTNNQASKLYDFCVSNFRVLISPDAAS